MSVWLSYPLQNQPSDRSGSHSQTSSNRDTAAAGRNRSTTRNKQEPFSLDSGPGGIQAKLPEVDLFRCSCVTTPVAPISLLFVQSHDILYVHRPPRHPVRT